MKPLAISVFALACSASLSAAEVTVTACASATITHTTMPQLVHGFPEECVTLTSTLEADADAPYRSESESKTLDFAFGGCAHLGTSTGYIMEHRWRYSIVTSAGAGERADAFVSYDMAPEVYTEGEGRFVESVTGEVKEGECADFFLQLTAGYSIATGLDSSKIGDPRDANGIFYDPENPGHGIDINVHSQGFTVYYYGHSAEGERLWLISQTVSTNLVYGQTYQLKMYEVSEGTFGQPKFPATEWGIMSLVLYDCDSGHADFDGVDGTLSMDLARVVRAGDSSCE